MGQWSQQDLACLSRWVEVGEHWKVGGWWEGVHTAAGSSRRGSHTETSGDPRSGSSLWDQEALSITAHHLCGRRASERAVFIFYFNFNPSNREDYRKSAGMGI